MPTFATPRPIAITIDLSVGNVRVTAGDRADTVATAQPTDPSKAADVAAASELQIEGGDGHLTINAPKHWKRFSPFNKEGSVQLVLEVPTGSELEVATMMGDIQVEGELGRSQVKTGFGNVRLDHVGRLTLKTGFGTLDVDRVDGDAEIATGSGEVHIGRVTGATLVRNSNGATSIGHVTGDVRVKAANGNISIDRADASVTAKTAAGSIVVGELHRGVTILESSAGSLSAGIAEGTAAALDVRSRSGQIRSALEASDGPAPTDEVLELRAHTSAGDITLFRPADHRVS